MIILVENDEDRKALNEMYLYIENQIDEEWNDIDLRAIKPLYNANVINIKKEPQA